MLESVETEVEVGVELKEAPGNRTILHVWSSYRTQDGLHCTVYSLVALATGQYDCGTGDVDDGRALIFLSLHLWQPALDFL